MSDSHFPAIRELSLSTWQVINTVAPSMHASRMYGVASPEQAAMLLLTSFELNLPFTAAARYFDIIQGKPWLKPRGALALIYRSKELAGMKIVEEPTWCRVWMKRTTGVEYEATFSLDDAKRAGLMKDGGGWTKYPTNMLRARAVGIVADVVFADVLGGLQVSTDLVDDNVIDGTWTEAPAVPASTPNLNDLIGELINKYGADAIMAANAGLIPGTIKEARTAEMVLAAEAAESAGNNEHPF